MTSGEFVVHIVDEGNVEKINQTAAMLPRQESEVSLANLTPINSDQIDVPGIKEAKIRMECVLEHSIELGDSHSPSSDLIIGKVVQFHIDPSIYHQGRINPRGLGALKKMDGVTAAEANVEAGKVNVTFDESKVNVEAVKEAIEEQGYDVEA